MQTIYITGWNSDAVYIFSISSGSCLATSINWDFLSSFIFTFLILLEILQYIFQIKLIGLEYDSLDLLSYSIGYIIINYNDENTKCR